jgi:hypothetical protein
MIHRRTLATLVIGAAVAGLGAGLLVTSDASARTSFPSAYTLEQNYSASLRMIRVDMGLKITEKDPEAAYIMFEYKSSENGNKVTPGSIEMVPQESKVQIVIQLPQMPQYHEEVMATNLKRKLQQDYGDPPKQRPPAKAKPDAGADAPPESGNEESVENW